MRITLIVAWYDLWVGAYWDRKGRRLYVLPIPCVGLVFHFPRKPKEPAREDQDQ